MDNDHIVVMNDGIIQDYGTPTQIINKQNKLINQQNQLLTDINNDNESSNISK